MRWQVADQRESNNRINFLDNSNRVNATEETKEEVSMD